LPKPFKTLGRQNPSLHHHPTSKITWARKTGSAEKKSQKTLTHLVGEGAARGQYRIRTRISLNDYS